MTTAEEMLAAALSESELEYSMSHRHSVYDSDNHFTIDPATMEIVKDPAAKGVIVQRSHNSERFTFELPRFGFDGHDMSLCNQVEVHYTNKEKTSEELTGVEHGGVYEVQDLQIYPKNSDIVVLSWLITADSTQLAGELEFALRFLCLTGTEIEYELPTAIFTGITVLPGKNNGQAVIENNTDLVAQFIQETNDQIEANMQSLEDAVTQSAVSQQAAAASQAAAAEAQAGAENAARQVQAIVAGNEAHTKYEADLRTAPPIVETAEGKAILVTDSAERPLQGLRVFGKTEQQTYTGAQLLDLSGIDKTMSFGGTMKMEIKDETVHVTGALDEGGFLIVRGGFSAEDAFLTLEPGTYTLSYGWLCSFDTSVPSSDREKAGTFTLTEPFAVYGYATPRYETGVEVDETFKPMLNKGSTALPWEPYTGGQACPCPDYPQELKHIESPTVEVYGKNLLHNTLAKATNSGITYTANADGSVTINGTATDSSYYTFDFANEIPVKGEELILSCGNNTGAVSLVAGYFLKDGTVVNNLASVTKKEAALTYPEEAYTTRTFMAVNAGVTINNLTVWPMLRLAAADNTPEPYKAPQVLALAHSLPGIPVTSGGNYTDENGQQYICDEVDLARGVYVQRCKTIQLTGSESWQTYHHSAYGVTHGFRLRVADMREIKNVQFIDTVGLLSSHFLYGGYVSEHQETGVGTSEAQYVYLRFDGENDTITTLEELTALLSAKAAAGDPVTVTYELDNPVETALSAEEVTAYQAILSHCPSTTVLNDSQAHMALDYVADTKTYIDNKFAALAAANS